MFVCGDEVIFNEVSPRPHDTGMVTLISQELSEFALHARAILGLPIPEITLISPSASKAIVVEGQSKTCNLAISPKYWLNRTPIFAFSAKSKSMAIAV